MTWDSSWKDITALDGLKRQPILTVHYNDLIAALKERYNNTEDLEVESRDKILLPPYGQQRFGYFDPWDDSTYTKYYDPDMWENGELKPEYDPTGKCVYDYETGQSNWNGLEYGSKLKFLTKMGYSEPPKPSIHSLQTSAEMIFFKEALRYCRNPVLDIRTGYDNARMYKISSDDPVWRETVPFQSFWIDDAYERADAYGDIIYGGVITEGTMTIKQITKIKSLPHRLRMWATTFGLSASHNLDYTPIFPEFDTPGKMLLKKTINITRQNTDESESALDLPKRSDFGSVANNHSYHMYPSSFFLVDNIAFEYV